MKNIPHFISVFDSTGRKESVIGVSGTSAVDKKNFDKLTRRYGSAALEFENTPMPAFRITDIANRYSLSPDRKWNVTDPRGFQVAISSENLLSLIQNTNIIDGLVDDVCVWARDGDNNNLYLLNCSSPEYKTYVENSKLLANRPDIKDVEVGDSVTTTKGLTGIYCGTYSLYSAADFRGTKTCTASIYRNRHIIRADKHGANWFYFTTNPDILKIEQKKKVDINQTEFIETLNKQLAEAPEDVKFFNWHNSEFTGIDYTAEPMRRIGKNTRSKMTCMIEEINRTQADELKIESFQKNDSGMLLLEDANGLQYLIDISPKLGYKTISSQSNAPTFNTLTVKHCTTGVEFNKFEIVSGRRTYFVNYALNTADNKTLDDFVKFYKIVKKHLKLTYV